MPARDEDLRSPSMAASHRLRAATKLSTRCSSSPLMFRHRLKLCSSSTQTSLSAETLRPTRRASVAGRGLIGRQVFCAKWIVHRLPVQLSRRQEAIVTRKTSSARRGPGGPAPWPMLQSAGCNVLHRACLGSFHRRPGTKVMSYSLRYSSSTTCNVRTT
jgi:hypothetical protein